MKPFDITIYHNPRCSNSRGALALIQDAGFTPVVIDYLQAPPSHERLVALLREAGLTAAELVRSKEPVFAELGLDSADEARLIDAMLAHPVLINRPLVVTPLGTRLCRPPERVKEILPAA
jgi:arsenate reductase